MKIEICIGELFNFQIRTDIFGCIKRAITNIKYSGCGKAEKECDTSAEYTEEYSDETSEYEQYLKNMTQPIDNMVKRFEQDLKVDKDGLYDIPPNHKTEIEENFSDVEIIDDAYEKELEQQFNRVRGV